VKQADVVEDLVIGMFEMVCNRSVCLPDKMAANHSDKHSKLLFVC